MKQYKAGDTIQVPKKLQKELYLISEKVWDEIEKKYPELKDYLYAYHETGEIEIRSKMI